MLVPVLAAVLLLLLPPVRALVLQEALRRAGSALPGELFVAAPSWPGLGHLRLDDVRWTASGDTLLSAEGLNLDVALLPLLRKDVHVRNLEARRFVLDLPALRAAFPAKADTTAPPAEKKGGGFPRSGAIPGVPSVAVDRFRVDAPRVRLTPDRTLRDLLAAGGLDLRRGTEGRVAIEELRLVQPEDGLEVERLRLSWIPDGPGEIDADGAGRLGPDFPFVLSGTTTPDGAFRLSLLESPGREPPEAAGLVATGRFLREEHDLKGLTTEIRLLTPGTRELARIPILAEAMRSVPELRGVSLRAVGEMRFDPARAGRLRADLDSNGYLEGGVIGLAFGPDSLAVDTLALDFPDLALRGRLLRAGDRQEGEISARIRGRRWIRPFTDPEGLPDSLAVDLDAALAGTVREPLINAEIRGAFRRDNLRVQTLAIDVEGNLGADRGARLALTGRSGALALAATGHVTLEDRAIEARLSPLVLTDLTEESRVRVPPLPGAELRRQRPHAVFERATGRLRLAGLRLAGSFGEGTIDGAYQGDEGGRFDLRVAWPRLPEALAHRIDLSREAEEDLAARWRREGDLHFRAELRVEREAAGMALAATGDLRLPGPRTLRPLLPAGAQVEDLGPLAGRFRARMRPAEGGSRTSFALDLAETDWIDRLHVEGRQERGLTFLDTLGVAVLGFDAHGRTAVRGGALAGSFVFALRDERLLRRFAPSLGDTIEARLAGRADLAGTTGAPSLSAEATGRFRTRPVDVPAFTARVLRDAAAGLRVDLRVPAGFRASQLALDSLRAGFRQEASPPAPDGARPLAGRVSLSGRGPDLALDHGFRVRQERGWVIETDTLVLTLNGRDLRARQPFGIHWREDRALLVRDLDLGGSLGTLRAHGVYAPGGTDLTLEAGLEPPEQPAAVALPAGLWPTRLDLRLRALEGDTLALTADMAGLQIGSRENVFLTAGASALGEEIAVRLHLEDRKGPGGVDRDLLLDLHGSLAARLSLSPWRFESRRGAFTAQAVLRAFPLPAQAGNPMEAPGYLDRGGQDREPVLDGLARIEGTTRSPVAEIAGIVRFPEYGDLEDYTVRLRGRVLPTERGAWPDLTAGRATGAASSGGAAPGSVRADPGTAPAAAGDSLSALELEGLPALPEARAGLTAGLSAYRRDAPVLTGDLFFPLRFSLAPAEADPLEERDLALRVEGRDIGLGDIAPLFPTVRSLEGKADLRLSASGAPDAARLEGEVDLRDAGVRLRNGTRAEGEGRVEVSGTLDAPVVRGRIRVDNGRILIPEADRTLHALDDRALLWSEEAVAAAAPEGPGTRATTPEEQALARRDEASTPAAAIVADADSASRQSRAADSLRTFSGEPPGMMERVDLAVTLRMPAGVWLEGRGLEAELTGDVELEQRGGKPVLTGTVEARQGSMEFHGRGLDIQEGTVTFYGSEEINPSLDLTLFRRQGDVLIRAHITGTVARPRLELESEPEMDQADIFSVLLFGRRADNLSQEENQRLEDRAMATAEQFAASQLTARLSQEIGLDLLSYEQSQEDSLGRAVTVGKYLSPNLLVKYEQALEQDRGFDIVIQYFIGNGFSLQMRGGRGRDDQSGIALDWGQNF